MSYTEYKSTKEPLIGGALIGETKMTEEKINELKAKAFDLIVKSDALFLDEDGNVRIDCPDCQGTNQHRIIGNITDAEHSFLSLVMSEEYELAEGELK